MANLCHRVVRPVQTRPDFRRRCGLTADRHRVAARSGRDQRAGIGHDGPESSVLLIGLQPFGEVSPRRGKPGFAASLLLPTGRVRRRFAKREAAEAFVLDGLEDYVLQQLTPAARCVLLRLTADLPSTAPGVMTRVSAMPVV